MNNKKKKLILGAIVSIIIFGITVNSIQFVINNREKDSRNHNFWDHFRVNWF